MTAGIAHVVQSLFTLGKHRENSTPEKPIRKLGTHDVILITRGQHESKKVIGAVAEMLYEVLRTSLRVPDGSYGPY